MSKTSTKFRRSGYNPSQRGSVLVNTKKQRPSNSSKGILKHPYEQESLATKSGIMRKDGSRLHREGLGMNPNLNFEDEYIENLLKQIHFMNMECKLLKEKQKEGKGYLGIRGMIERDKDQIYHHINQANTKFQSQQKSLMQQLMDQDRAVEDQKNSNYILSSDRNYMRQYLKDIGKKFQDIYTVLLSGLKKNQHEYQKQKNQRENIGAKLDDVRFKLEQATKQYDILDKECQFLDLNKSNELYFFNRGMDSLQEKIDKSKNRINTQKDQRTDLVEERESNEKLKFLTNKQKNLIKELRKRRMKVSALNYELYEKQQLMVLADQQHDKNSDEVTKFQNEICLYKGHLEERLKQNNVVIQRGIQQNQSPSILKAQATLAKKQSLLNELNKKLLKLNERQKKFQVERIGMNFLSSRLEDSLLTSNVENEKIENELQVLEPSIQKNKHDLQTKVKQLEDNQEKFDDLDTTLNSLIKTNTKLRAECEQRKNNIDIQDVMQKANPQKLSTLVQTNSAVNENINDFLNKWQNIKALAQKLQ